MGIDNKLVLCQVTICVLSFVLSFFMFVPVSINQQDFNGNCLLYAEGQWNTSSQARAELYNVKWGSGSACNITVFMGVVIMLLSLFYIILGSCYLLRESDSSWLEAFISTAVAFIITVMMFASTLTLTVGFRKWCDLITRPESQIVSCEVADFIPFGEELDIKSQSFYTQFSVAEFGSWVNFFCWVLLLIMAAIKLLRYQRHESFMSSVGRERQRLLQKVGHGGQSAI